MSISIALTTKGCGEDDMTHGSEVLSVVLEWPLHIGIHSGSNVTSKLRKTVFV